MVRLTVSVAIVLLFWTALGQTPGVLKQGVFEGHPSLLISNDKLELSLWPTGGAMVNLVLKDDAEKLSPLWNPARYAREAGREFKGYSIGHFVCVDGFGPVSRQESAAGLNGHGEAHQLPWDTKTSSKDGAITTLAMSVTLPKVQETLTRTHRMVDGENVVYVTSELESLLAFDRPICWAEHATIGAPFLEPAVTAVDMAAARGRTRRYSGSGRPGSMSHRLASYAEFTWPRAPGVNGGFIDVRKAPLNPNSGDHTACLMDPSRQFVFVTALNPKRNLLFGYVFRREDFPWLQSWEFYPSNGQLARGLEFSTQPFDVSRREALETFRMFDAPTYRWLPAKTKIESKFLMFYTRVPPGFERIDDVVLEGGKLTINDRQAGKQITLAASQGL